MQHECIPQAILGMDILCQAKSGMGKTAVFVLSVLQQIETDDKEEEATVKAVVLCHTRELAFQVRIEDHHISARFAAALFGICRTVNCFQPSLYSPPAMKLVAFTVY